MSIKENRYGNPNQHLRPRNVNDPVLHWILHRILTTIVAWKIPLHRVGFWKLWKNWISLIIISYKKKFTKEKRLDYWNLVNLVENCVLKPRHRSERSTVLLEIKFNPFNRRRGLWKLYNNWLASIVFPIRWSHLAIIQYNYERKF